MEKAKLMLQAIFHLLCGELGHAQMKRHLTDTSFTGSFLQSRTKLRKNFSYSCLAVQLVASEDRFTGSETNLTRTSPYCHYLGIRGRIWILLLVLWTKLQIQTWDRFCTQNGSSGEPRGTKPAAKSIQVSIY